MTYRNLSVVIVLALGFAFTLVHARGPAPKPASATSSVFSAQRAATILADLVGDGVPHPIGTAAHDVVRDRIVQHLRRLGYQPEVESGFACSTAAVCAEVQNITAVVGGAAERPAVMLAAHYDSVAAGPGASDDGTGVAALLEIARILASEPAHRNPIVLLFDDGEEAGLIGAESFVARSRWAKRVAVVVNIDARGTSGESFMFETTPGHRWLIDLLARSVERPDTSSLFYEVYKRLPNDTDFTVFKRAGKEGVNFAYLGDVNSYHTPLDNLRNASRRSLQHHGDNVLGMVRALAAADLGHRQGGDVVWFDLLSACVVRWPVSWSVPMALLALLIAVAATFLGRRADRVSFRSVALGLAWFVATLAAAGAVTIGITALLKIHFGAATWPAQPMGAIAAAWLVAIVVPLALGRWLGARASESGLFAGAAVGWSILALATAWSLPGASYLFIPIAIIVALGVMFEATANPGLSAVLKLAAMALSVAMLFPLAWTLYDALGIPALFITSILVALASTTWCGMTASWPGRVASLVSSILGVLVVIAVGTAMFSPVYSPSSPQRLNIILHADSDAQTARWLTSVPRNELPPAMAAIGRWSVEHPFRWYANASYNSLRTPMVALAGPVMSHSEERAGGRRRLLVRLHSVRGANTITLNLHDGGRLESARVNGWMVTPFPARYRKWLSPGWTRLVVRGGADVDFDLLLRGTEPLDTVIEDVSYGLPASGARLVAARGASAVPTDGGDVTIVSHAIRF
jgi:hypothetical protein